MGRGVALALLVALAPATALAADAPSDPEAVRRVASASNAFEYRDFKKVIELLHPFVHPPRISDPALMKEARRLLGISYHIQGDLPAAREEFSQALLLDPTLKLDPFLVPPAVIETFESVRASMQATLDRLSAQRRDTPEDPPQPAGLPHPLIAFAPLGFPQFFALDEPGWGSLWLSVQLAGLAANGIGFWGAEQLKDEHGITADKPARHRMIAVQFVGLGVFTLGWLGSIIEARGALQARRDALLAVPAGRPQQRLSIGAGPDGVSLQIPF